MKNYEFDNSDAVLDPSSGQLRTRSGDLVDLRPQSREVLRLLAAAPNRTVTKEEFSAAVWQGRQVSEDSLVQCIAEIRAALGDRDRTIIQTVPRKGYRFAPPAGRDAPQDQPRRGRLALTALALAAVVAALALLTALLLDRGHDAGRPPVVAVLPLEDLSATPYQDYLSDALSEGIITALARFPQFRVVARNSSFQFREDATDVRRIGDVLGAGYVLEGSQQYDGQRIRVTIQLVETDGGAHLFSDQYERDLDDLFVVQNDIVRQVASVVGQSILTEMPGQVAEQGVDSMLRGLQARKIMSQLSYENWQKALALEETSIREEPGSPWGYIGKSLMLGVAAQLGWREPRDAVLAEATDLAETALRLAPENYMAHFTMARVKSRTGELDEAILHFQRAGDLNPSDSLVLIGLSRPLLHAGRTDEAIEVLNRAAEVDPLHGDWLRWQLAWAYWQRGDCDQALAAMQSMSSPPQPSRKTLATIFVCLDRLDEARAALAPFLADNPDHTLAVEAAMLPPGWDTRDRYLGDLRAAGMR